MAKIFRLQDNVPDTYVRQSRDFQLLCNLFDILQGGIKYDIDTITSVNSTRYCSEKLLPLLQTKLGFWTSKQFTSSELRAILASFQDIVKDKGSIKGIREAIELYLKIVGASRKSRVLVTNAVESKDIQNLILHNSSYNVEILVEGEVMELSLLTEILKYVIPAGYRLNYSFYRALDSVEYIAERGTINVIIVSSAVNNRVVAKDSSEIDTRLLRYIFAKDIVKDDVTYYTKGSGNEFTSTTYDAVCQNATAVEQVISYTPIQYASDYEGTISTIKETESKLYLLVHQVEPDAPNPPNESGLFKFYNNYTNKHYYAIKCAGSAYIPELTYYEDIETKQSDNSWTLEPVNDMSERISTTEDEDNVMPYYTLGKNTNSQNYLTLMNNDALGYMFTEYATTCVWTTEVYFEETKLRRVLVDEVFDTNKEYYTDVSGLTDDVEYLAFNTYYLLSRNWKKLLAQDASILRCVWNIDNNPLLTSPEDLYYTRDTEKVLNSDDELIDMYKFKKNQEVYYIQDVSQVLVPGQVNTTSVVDVEHHSGENIHTDSEGNDIFGDSGYTLKYLNGEINNE